jgi:hypothetical protein
LNLIGCQFGRGGGNRTRTHSAASLRFSSQDVSPQLGTHRTHACQAEQAPEHRGSAVSAPRRTAFVPRLSIRDLSPIPRDWSVDLAYWARRATVLGAHRLRRPRRDWWAMRRWRRIRHSEACGEEIQLRRLHFIWILATLSTAGAANGHEAASHVASEAGFRVEVLRGSTLSIVARDESGELNEVVVRPDPNPRPTTRRTIVREVIPTTTINVYLDPGDAIYPSPVVWLLSNDRDEKRFQRFGHAKRTRAWMEPLRGGGLGRGGYASRVRLPRRQHGGERAATARTLGITGGGLYK